MFFALRRFFIIQNNLISFHTNANIFDFIQLSDTTFDCLRQTTFDNTEQQPLSSPRIVARELNPEQAMKSKTIRGLLSGEIASPFAPDMNDSFNPQTAQTTPSDNTNGQPKKVCPVYLTNHLK